MPQKISNCLFLYPLFPFPYSPLMEFFRLQYSNNGHVAEIVLNQPQRFNVISPKWASSLSTIVDQVQNDDNVKVILIWAEGKLFTAGLDLKEFGQIHIEEGSTATRSSHFLKTLKNFRKPLVQLHNSKKPVVAAIHGKCVGGGVDLICSCDIRLCTSDASFSIKETQMGIVADLGTIPWITRIVGKGIYSEMLFTGEPLPAERALQSGLVNLVFKTKEDLLEGARSLCSKISENSPLVVQGVKTVLMFAEEHSTDDTLDYVGLWNSSFLESEDLREALAAFVQKRKPKFSNKL